MEESAVLQTAFNAFTRGGPTMDGRTFVKLCKDCKLVDKVVTTIDIDLIFAKVKEKGQRTISFSAFERSLKLIAEKKKLPLFKIVEQVQSAKGPQFVGTTADAVRFHDDKSTYTGVYANGGPSTVDTAKSRGADLTKRPANVRGVKK
eukprot:GHVT01063834.1.p1 GENE.GHVT01063834.1~~GHVT01063834.1.p1  ORF type:complete len:147 (-),score=18.84 GHVT01063834.1:670-1110(-)